ncbi:hypothetical protein JB92DRAFT_3000811 [Gautieria morchelliformis]|nr:hypothetical protein JB92DRAFT_3000811 [Gautieria morchelliformis]
MLLLMPLMTPPTPRPRTVPLPEISLYYSPGPWTNAVGNLPSPTTPTIQLHEMLRPSSPRHVYYDLDSPPTSVIFPDEQYTSFMLSMAATNPPLTYLRIMLPTTPPLPVMVYNMRSVTVFDVLNAIYRRLHAPDSSSVWEEIDYLNLRTRPPIPMRATSFDIPRTFRSSSIPEARRKIEHLHGRTSFVGLMPGPDGSNSWNLHTTE